MNDAVKVARINADRDKALAAIGLVKGLLTNPVIELVGAVVLVETLQRYPKDRPIIGNIQGNLIEGGIGAIIGLQQLAPLMPYVSSSISDITKLAAPLALAAGA